MFSIETYQTRRRALRDRLGAGLLLFPGNEPSAINFPHNPYPYRQDSTFNYFFGIRRPGLAALIDADGGVDTLFGDEATPDETLWLGERPSLRHQAERAGITRVEPLAALDEALRQAQRHGRTVHYLPPYQARTVLDLSRWLDLPAQAVAARASLPLIRAVVALREIKSADEIAQIEQALDVTHAMHLAAMQLTRPGRHERDVVADMQRVALSRDAAQAYAPIFTRRKDGLHAQVYDQQLRAGDLVINDAGACSPLDYASDVTRTLPVSGRYDTRQRELYELLLRAQLDAIAAIRPGQRYADIHRQTCLALVQGLSELGIFQGDPQAIVDAGAHALCFPHGLGHQLGLDVHDMEALGEDHVGYDQESRRGDQFGLCYLRLAKRLRAGMVLTVEPGIYFMPALIDRWRAERRHEQYIRYARLETYRDAGGMRIEDVVCVGADGARVLGAPIPKTVAQVEAAMS